MTHYAYTLEELRESVATLAEHCAHEWSEMQDASRPWSDITVPISDLERVLNYVRSQIGKAP